MNAFSLLIQVFIVSRVFTWIGIQGALLILPIIALIGYGLVVFLPIFSIIRVVKMVENGTDYSLMNTARQALFLPLSEADKYQSKIAIDTFFWRFGDLIQAAGIYLGLHYFGFDIEHFALMNMFLCVLWILLVVFIQRHYLQHCHSVSIEEPPILTQAVKPQCAPEGKRMCISLPDNIFVCAEAGDVITYHVRYPDGKELPGWLHFDKYRMTLSGTPSSHSYGNLVDFTSHEYGRWVVRNLFQD